MSAIAGLLERVREHYLDQFRAFVAKQSLGFKDGSAEIKLKINGRTSLYRDLVCIDLIRNASEPERFELEPDYLKFDPIAGTIGQMMFRMRGLRWDDANFTHDKPGFQPDCIAEWFETWFDPEDERADATGEFSGTIHSCMVSEQSVSVDFGSAPVDAFWSLLEILEKAGARNVAIDTTTSDDDSPAVPPPSDGSD
jgi:hypothetical protein